MRVTLSIIGACNSMVCLFFFSYSSFFSFLKNRFPFLFLLLLSSFFQVEESYHPYPKVKYHNNIHAADVMHSTHVLLKNAAFSGVCLRHCFDLPTSFPRLLPPTPSPQCRVMWSACRCPVCRADWRAFGPFWGLFVSKLGLQAFSDLEVFAAIIAGAVHDCTATSILFWTISRAFLSSTPPCTRCVSRLPGARAYRMLIGALQSNVVPDSRGSSGSHPGRTNAFLIKTSNNLAMLYNVRRATSHHPPHPPHRTPNPTPHTKDR